jgi:hypothetical protein
MRRSHSNSGVTLVSYAKGCETGILKKSLVAAGVVMDQDAHPVTRCIKVRSEKGKDLRTFVQDVVSDFLPKEVPLGKPVTLYAIHIFTAPEGPGLLVNEFLTEANNDSTESGSSSDQRAGTAPPCGCGTADFHPGMDVTNDAAGAPVRAVDDGIVVKVDRMNRPPSTFSTSDAVDAMSSSSTTIRTGTRSLRAMRSSVASSVLTVDPSRGVAVSREHSRSERSGAA